MTSRRARWITFAILATVPWLASAGDRVDPALGPTTNGHRPAPFTRIATQDDTGLTLAIRIPRSALELHSDVDGHRVVSLASVHGQVARPIHHRTLP